jgi:hypothetical protein
MKTRNYFLIISAFYFLRVSAQVNVVSNPSFELYDTCPYWVAQINFASGWFQPNNPGVYGSTDYFNSCSGNNISSVPVNVCGFQPAHTGQGYCGLGMVVQLSWNDGREYVEGTLTQALDSNKHYCISFYSSLSNNSELSTAIGIKLTNDSLLYSSSTYQTMGVVPQIVITDVIALEDTFGWIESHSLYLANGGERYLTMGSFWNQPFLVYDCYGPSCGVAYYYIDDVSVVLLPELDAGYNDTICLNDSTMLNGTISETWPGMSFEWLPHAGLSNPFSLATNVSPSSTTTYTLTVSCATCDVPCLSDIPDSVTITVVPQISTGTDDTVCVGDSILLSGTISENWIGMQYEWTPHAGLSNPYSLNTLASPAFSTTYTLAATCPSCGFGTCLSLRDSLSIALKMDCVPVFNEMIIPTVIGEGQRWELQFLPPQTRVKIYDEGGRIIYQSENYQNEWAPKIAGAIYLYEITLDNGVTSNGKILVK